jgi:type I restriction enzyme S subunit
MEMEFSASDFDRYQLKYGDILLCEGQSPQYLGRPAMFRDELPGVCFTNTLIRFRANQEILNRDYALLAFRHYMHDGKFQDEGTITTNIAHLGAGRFAKLEMQLPTLPEQQEIVRRVEELFALADRIEARLAVVRKTADRLTPAVLAKAFRGELVPQDPNDEPASVLLERLQSQAAAQPARAPRKKRA